MRSVVRGGALIAIAEGSQQLFAPLPVQTQMGYGQAYANPAYVQLVDGAQYPVAYVQPSVQPVYAEQGSSWSDIAMMAVMGAAVGGAIGYAAKARAGDVQMADISAFDDIWGFDAKKAIFDQWNPEAPRDYNNFNPFERNDEGSMADTNGCFPGQSRGYKSPNRPDQSWAIMQEEKLKMEQLALDPKFNAKGRPGNFSPKWQKDLGSPP
jgi:hypothetical protein